MKRFMLVLAFVLTAISAHAQWKMDPYHSSVGFSVRHMVISDVSGNFKDFAITLTSAKSDFSDATIDAVIHTASINTENDYRDKHLKSDDFFNAEKYPEIKFKSTSFEKISDTKYKITGDLTIRDVTKNVTFMADLLGTITTQGAMHSGWKATTVINRFDYNLKWNKTLEAGGLVVGQDVTITLNLEFTK